MATCMMITNLLIKNGYLLAVRNCNQAILDN